MRIKSHSELALEMCRKKGILRSSDLGKAGIPRVVLARLTAIGRLERVGRGLYRLPDAQITELESLNLVAARTPQAVFCLLTALHFHELTTQIPHQIWIAMPQGSHIPKIDYPPLKMIQVSGEAFSQGIEIHESNQIQLKTYCVARTVADCFKHRNKIGLDVALEALKDAWRQRKASVDEIWHYAQVCSVANVMRPYLEVITHT